MERLSHGVDFELFRALLTEGLHKEPAGLGGRPPYDYVLMLKILILQRYYNLSDDQVEFQINDRISFMRFLGLTVSDDVPDSRTVRHFREGLMDLGLIDNCFDLFLSELARLGLSVHEGRIVDASFVEVPRQRNSRDDNKTIKEGGIPERIAEHAPRKAQKDLDVRWTKKNGVSYFGFKNHVKCDSSSKLVLRYATTDASVHDSQALGLSIDKKSDEGRARHADSAYVGQEQERTIRNAGMENHVHEKGVRNRPLDDAQKASNRAKSATRARVEHIFGFMESCMNGMSIQVIGRERVHAMVGLMDLTYNMFRGIQLRAA